MVRNPTSSVIVSPLQVTVVAYSFGWSGVHSWGRAFIVVLTVPAASVVSVRFIFSSGMLSVTVSPAFWLFRRAVKSNCRGLASANCRV